MIWSLTSLRANRVSGSENFRSSFQKTLLQQYLPTTEVATNSITSSAGEQGLRNGEAERLSSGKVDDEFKCFWYLDW
jgi:hypothetical protein